MVFITKEEKKELVVGFIQYVFSEIQIEGWKVRRDELLSNNPGHYHEYVNKDKYEEINDITFNEMMVECNYDENEFIVSLFYPILSTFGWFECWLCQQRPDIYEDSCPLSEWETLYYFINKDNDVEDIKELIGLNHSLK